MIINHNMPALNTYRQLSANSAATSKSLEKLSSGLRINKAGDDAAGLAISERMRSQIRGLDQATRNAQDGISMSNTAEGALSETQNILQRMRDLAVQASNDTNTTQDRKQIQEEVNQLTSEINRIGNTTEFNTQKLLKGTNLPVTTTAQTTNTIQAGVTGTPIGATSALAVGTKSVAAIASTTAVQGNQAAATGAVGNFAITTNSVAGAFATADLKNGLHFSTKNTGTTYNDAAVKINVGAEGSGTANTFTVTGSGSSSVYTFNIGGDNDYITSGELYNALQAATNTSGGTAFSADANLKLDVPSNTAAPISMATISDSQTLAGGITEAAGVYNFDLTKAFKEVGDTITVAGKTFTAAGSTADAAKGEFDISSGAIATQVTNLIATMDQVLSAATGNNTFEVSAGATSSNIVLTQVANTAKGVDLAAPTVAGAGTDDKLLVSNAGGQNLATIGITKSVATTAAAPSTTNTNADGFNVIAGVNGAELNGVKIQFATTESAGAASLTPAWNAGTRTLTISGTFDVTANKAANQVAATSAIQTGLTSAGFNVGTLTNTAAAGGLTAGTSAAFNLTDITFANGVGDGKASSGTAIDTNLIIKSGTTGTALNGVKVAFASTMTDSASATALTSSWDATSRTLTIDGNMVNTAGAAAITARNTALLSAIQTGLTDAGFDVGTMTKVDGATASAANLKSAGSFTFGSGATAIASADTMVVDQNDGNLTINLATTTASKNSAAKIQAAVQALGTVTTSKGTIDFSKYTFTASGNWDTKTVGEDITRTPGTLVGGTVAVQGQYNFTVDKAFGVGDIVRIKDQEFTAVASGADVSKNQFNVGSGDVNAQAASLRTAINSNLALATKYTAGGTGNTVNLLENTASGVDMKTTDQQVSGTGVQGQYSVKISNLLENGAAFVLDGQEIKASGKATHSGYSDGTAFKVGATVADQNKAIADAINLNATLKTKYTASVDSTSGALVLNQTASGASSTAPVVQTKSSALGDFTSNLQIGANAGQTMTINIKDMRSNALAVAGDGSIGTVTANDGKVASYVTTANVTNGTDNTNVEFALDLSTSAKATAAVSVLDDAINAVLDERSKLGAYTNRLDHTVANLGTSSENLTAAESRVRDADMAKEMMTFQKNNILQQAANAMMAQANQQGQGVLQLLR